MIATPHKCPADAFALRATAASLCHHAQGKIVFESGGWKVARELLAKIKELIVINWRQKSMARSQLKLSIEDVLDKGLPRVYSPELYKQKCTVVFQHFYENYSDKDASVYAAAS